MTPHNDRDWWIQPTYQARLESDSQRRIAIAAASLRPHVSVLASTRDKSILAITDNAGSSRVIGLSFRDAIVVGIKLIVAAFVAKVRSL
jgi:hypothetical protein